MCLPISKTKLKTHAMKSKRGKSIMVEPPGALIPKLWAWGPPKDHDPISSG